MKISLFPKLLLFFSLKKSLAIGLFLGIINLERYYKLLKFLRRYSEETFNVPHKSKLIVSLLDSGTASPLVLSGNYESNEIKFIWKKLKNCRIALDIGANVGYYSVILGKLFGETGMIFAFEPDMYNFSLLDRNIKLNNLTSIFAENIAISDKNGVQKLYLSGNNMGDHKLYKEPWKVRKWEKVGVKTIDSYLNDKKVHKIDFVKVDVQGFEPMVIRGMRKTLDKNPHLKALIEFWPKGILDSGNLPEPFFEELKEHFNSMTLISAKGKLIKNLKRYENIDKVTKEEEFVNLFCENNH